MSLCNFTLLRALIFCLFIVYVCDVFYAVFSATSSVVQINDGCCQGASSRTMDQRWKTGDH